MRKILTVVLLAFALSGCATVKLLTQSYDNPVTKEQLYAMENGATIVFAGLKAYRTACIEGAADKNCRANIAKIQKYTRKLPKLLADLRSYVKDNDQINAVVVYNTIVLLINDAKAVANANNVKVQ